jgi:hypothetical protein
MFSRILVKLIDQAIMPAILLLSARLISVVLISKYLALTFTINASGFAFQSLQEYVQVNSYSTLVILAALTIGLAYILLKSFAFHETHITPGLSAKLFSLKMPSLIQSSYELYSQGVIWLSYLFLITIVAGIMSFFGLLYAYVFYTGLALVVFSTVLFIFDVETELGIKKNGESYYEEEDK